MKGDIAYESLLKFILILVVAGLLIAFFPRYINDIYNWGCDYISETVEKLVSGSGRLC